MSKSALQRVETGCEKPNVARLLTRKRGSESDDMKKKEDCLSCYKGNALNICNIEDAVVTSVVGINPPRMPSSVPDV